MGRLLESSSKQLLAQNSISVPRHFVAASPAEVGEKAALLGGEVVLKALVPVGKRGKAGAIKFASDPAMAAELAVQMLGTVVRHYPVEEILVEEKLAIEHELFVSFTIDKKLRRHAVLVSSAGGIDVEEISAKYPERMQIIHIDPYKGLPDFRAKEVWADLGLEGTVLRQAS